MNATQDYMQNTLGVGTSDTNQTNYRKSPPAAQPTADDLGKATQNGRQITVLPHPPQEYVWR